MNISIVPECADVDNLEAVWSFPTIIAYADIQAYGSPPLPLLKRNLKL